MSQRLWVICLALCWPAASSVAAESKTALVIEKGSVARSQVVALGRDLVVAGEAASDVVSINGSTRVHGRVAGDVIRSVSYPTVSSAWLTLLEGPSLGLSPLSPLVLGGKLALLAAWLALTLLLLATSGGQVLSTSESVRDHPFHAFVVGLTGVLALLLTALFFSAFAAAIVGVPLLALVVLLALMLKLWGMVAVFHSTGSWLTSTLGRRRLQPLNCAVIGLLVLGCLKLVPWVGTWVWTVATFIGVGATLSTKFGRREPWFDFAVPSSLG
jgi:hypothetical protein